MRKVIILVVLIMSLAASQAFGMKCVTVTDSTVTSSPAGTQMILDAFRQGFPDRQIAALIDKMIEMGKADLINPGTEVEVLQKGFGPGKNIWMIKIGKKVWFTFYRFIKCGEDA